MNFGADKYPQLVALVKCVLSLSHGNSTPERGFSINKILLEIHGSRTYEDTIVALRMVKDAINRVGGSCKFPITRALVENVSNAWAKYEADRVARLALKEEEEKKRKQKEEEKRQQSEIDNKMAKIDEEIECCKSQIAVAE